VLLVGSRAIACTGGCFHAFRIRKPLEKS
jgi:hypothetical protein